MMQPTFATFAYLLYLSIGQILPAPLLSKDKWNHIFSYLWDSPG